MARLRQRRSNNWLWNFPNIRRYLKSGMLSV